MDADFLTIASSILDQIDQELAVSRKRVITDAFGRMDVVDDSGMAETLQVLNSEIGETLESSVLPSKGPSASKVAATRAREFACPTEHETCSGYQKILLSGDNIHQPFLSVVEELSTIRHFTANTANNLDNQREVTIAATTTPIADQGGGANNYTAPPPFRMDLSASIDHCDDEEMGTYRAIKEQLWQPFVR
ncbi:hypothetical protein BJ085DRAFT_32265 [Dimargaris cristalligena]|uniref:Uncharacterized protein n=1 Tax=Dimargaris cristalligena TaxID=215637 RepID=A0A4P9ZSL9_9FUNG|nr:hypothetical protein BJ085DRAFT_32265 [Dimargaris cristalligena]|eukprot:RKP36483.1 hypothetical protein BJ085DRAFT_32265 [Dimargaris cristalligena]